MKYSFGLHRFAMRLLALVVAGVVAGCSGANHLLPAPASNGTGVTGGTGGSASAGAAAWRESATRHRHRIAVRMRIRIPRRRGAHERIAHPATISSLTQSVGIAVDGGTQQLFNTTPASPGCSIGTSGLVCTFSVLAPIGTDTFVATTYGGTGGTGTALDRGVATVPIAVGKANAIAVSLGPVVTTTADSGIGSLRYAVGSANAGDTIMFLLPAGATIALATPVTITGNVSLAGPGAANLTISGGGTHQVFIVSGTATISGLAIAQGKAATANTPGGAIWNSGQLTLASDTVGTSTSIVSIKRARGGQRIAHVLHTMLRPHCTTTYRYGGALYNTGTLTMTGSTFNGNVVLSDQINCVDGYGGAIYNDVGGTISSTGDTFSNNSALEGGAVFNLGVGQVSFTGDTFSGNTGCNAASGCPTTGCNNSGCTTFATGEGGAIFDGGSGVTIASSSFTNNVAGGATIGSQGGGGALVLGGGAPTITGSTFSGNLAGGGTASCSVGQGGAIATLVPITIVSDTFTGNQAVGDNTSLGGAILAQSGAVTGSSDAFTSNAVVGSGSACNTSSSGGGGGIYALVSATLSNSTFSGNSASGNGEGAGGALAATDAFLTGDTFTSNTATATGAQGASSTAAGGAVLFQTLGKISGCAFTSNSATIGGSSAMDGYGGAIGDVAGTLVSSGNVFTSNTVTEAVGAGTVAGGAVVVIAGSASSTGDTFKSNAVSGTNTAGGGAAYIDAGYSISGALISGNSVSAPQAIGGALAIGKPGQLSNDTITGNSAIATGGLGAGGGMYDTGGATINNSTISQNTANAGGGAIYASMGESISGSTISGNIVTGAGAASAGGAGLYESAGTIITRTTIANNTLNFAGPGMSGGGGLFNGGGLLMTQSTISGNAALGTGAGSGGGAILNQAGAALLDVTISGNRSSLDGGGFFVASNQTITLSNTTLFKNAATGAGGNIDNPYALTLTNSIVAGGTASTGPDIDNAGTLTSGDYNIVQTAPAGNSLTGTTTHNLLADPQLLALANNGGPTFTNADQLTSPGRGYIPFSGSNCGSLTVPIDQRGYARGAGGVCDAGAFEYGGVPSAIRTRLPRVPGRIGTSHGIVNVRPFHLLLTAKPLARWAAL